MSTLLAPGTPHAVLGTPMDSWPEGSEVIHLAGGCFWGIERFYWTLPGVVTTSAGYMGGTDPQPTYRSVCGGGTGHAETVQVVFDPQRTSVDEVLKVFWENHDPTQGNRQGNDVGEQYRSAIFCTTDHQVRVAEATRDAMQEQLTAAGHGPITTEIVVPSQAGEYHLAEEYHQQYLHKNPDGYCNHGPNGMTCPVGLVDLPAQTDVLPPAE
ncbi:peptide-methionine (S)-S-oxide reductase MsrA [Kytococcus sp. Marseille-QA3725]